MSVLHEWRTSLSRRLRETILTHYLVPDSRFGLDPGLVPHLPAGRPVTLIDVGANRGDFAATVQAHSGLRSAILIEPQLELALALSQRFTDPAIRVANVAVSDAPGSHSFEVLQADSCSSLLPIRAEAGFNERQIDVRVKERYDIEVRTLDDVIDSAGWTGVIDLLKVDTQGNELQVINGAQRHLQSVRLLWIEVSFRSLYQGDTLFTDVHQALTALGFRLYSFHEAFRNANRELLQADALFLGPMAH
ncbi:MAG TPA: FkbM family methyltransferase [Vicinamibacterales bacterium]|jgi:FkbM family methyltransferase